MHFKKILAGLLFAVAVCTPVAAQDCDYGTVHINIESDFFRCAFLSRAEIALNAARNGDLTEDMVNDLTPEDRANLIVSINRSIEQAQSGLLSNAQQNWHKVGVYATRAVAIAGFLACLYNLLRVTVNTGTWLSESNLAWLAEQKRHDNWQVKQAKHLENSVLLRWEAGKSVLVLVGAAATYAIGDLGNFLLENMAANHEAALAELENLNGSLEFINSLPVVA